MSGTAKMRSRAPKATVWRESKSLLETERQSFYAQRNLCGLSVTLYAGGHVFAVVEYPNDWPVSEMDWPVTLSDRRNVDATIAIAQRWCEARADELRDARGAE